MINTTIHNYKILSLIGEGGMGSVYLAEDTMLDKKIAIKALNPALSIDNQFIERFRQEAKLQASLDHPNIIRIYTLLKENDSFFIVMEYAEGTTLRDIIKGKGAIDGTKALIILENILYGLKYAHRKGIIHRDIKPVNIMIGEDDSVKIMDFGIAKLLGDIGKTRTRGLIGTPHYMSPEQIKSPKSINQQSDLYSLGVTFYEMVTGKLPFLTETESDYELMSELIRTEIPDPKLINPKVTDKISNITRRLTKKDLAERFKSCDECIEEIHRKDEIKFEPKKIEKTEIFQEKTKVIDNKSKETALILEPGKIQKTSVIKQEEKQPATIKFKSDFKETKLLEVDKPIISESDNNIKEKKNGNVDLQSEDRLNPKSTLESIKPDDNSVNNNVIEKDNETEKDEKIKHKGISRKVYYSIGTVATAILIIFLIINFTSSEKKAGENNITIQENNITFKKDDIRAQLNEYLEKLYSKVSMQDNRNGSVLLSSGFHFDGISEGENKINPFTKDYKDDVAFTLIYKGITSDSLLENNYIGYYTAENEIGIWKGKISANTNNTEISLNVILYEEKPDISTTQPGENNIKSPDKKDKTTSKQDKKLVPEPVKKEKAEVETIKTSDELEPVKKKGNSKTPIIRPPK